MKKIKALLQITESMLYLLADRLGITGSPAIAEDVMVARDCMLALHTKAPVVIQHISSGNSVALVRLAKELGADIHAEATLIILLLPMRQFLLMVLLQK